MGVVLLFIAAMALTLHRAHNKAKTLHENRKLVRSAHSGRPSTMTAEEYAESARYLASSLVTSATNLSARFSRQSRQIINLPEGVPSSSKLNEPKTSLAMESLQKLERPQPSFQSSLLGVDVDAFAEIKPKQRHLPDLFFKYCDGN